MTKDEKELLLKDLCARLSYGIKVKRPIFGYPDYVTVINESAGTLTALYNGYTDKIEKFVPYLRPMLSMTEEEKKEYKALCIKETFTFGTWKSIDWLNAHYFDYRGLIEKGLAIEVTENNNPYE